MFKKKSYVYLIIRVSVYLSTSKCICIEVENHASGTTNGLKSEKYLH